MLAVASALACTNLMVTPGASKDGSVIYSYAADSSALYGTLDKYPGRKNIPEGTMKVIWDWDSGKKIGEIPEPVETYEVVGNMNEFQVTIGETTFGGLEQLWNKGQPGAIMDYGNLIWTTLQRSKTAQEAIAMMDTLTKEYGYVSEGESFTIADPNEVWVVEMIGRGDLGFGAVWVAKKVPDGHIHAHANQARITTLIEEENGKTMMWSEDVVQFAVDNGFYDPNDGPFSFSDVYAPMNFVAARAGEARVWSFFSKWSNIEGFEEMYYDYAGGWNLTNRMPWSVEPRAKLEVRDIMNMMRDHNDNTKLDMISDIGAGRWKNAFRERPLTWHGPGRLNKKEYINERTIGTQQTGWHFVANMRNWLPNHIGGVFWFGVDDITFSPHIPFYPYSKIPKALATGTGSITKFTFESMFWMNNLVANRAYTQWMVVAPIIQAKLNELEDNFFAVQPAHEAIALNSSQIVASQFLSTQSNRLTNLAMETWMELWIHLSVVYRDGVKIEANEPGTDHGGNQMGGETGKVTYGTGIGNGEWPDDWKQHIIDDTGDHFLVAQPAEGSMSTLTRFKHKQQLRRTSHYMQGKGKYYEDIESLNPIIDLV